MANAIQNLTCRVVILLAIGISCTSHRLQDPLTIITSVDGVWSRVDNKLVAPERSIVDGKPLSFAAFKIDLDKLNRLLQLARPSLRTSVQSTVLTLPAPDGSFPRFEITESPIMEPGLTERFPQIRAYKARGLDDRTQTGRFEFTPEGLHGMVIGNSGTFFVDNANNVDKDLYVSYFTNYSPPDRFAAQCLVKRPMHGACPTSRIQPRKYPRGDNELRTYRLAVAASHDYVAAVHQFINPTGSENDLLTDALSAIHRTINRVNLIFETDLNITFVLVADETKIIYANEELDPYAQETDHDKLLVINQTNLDKTIRSPNYDVGHLFTTLRGGAGAQPSACGYYKAWGVSGRERPLGNAFDVNLVAHELGHQFGASHSFNGTTLGCQFRNACTAYEPGSGSTIMSYASDRQICGTETVQALSDPYFHAKSLEEIRTFLTQGGQGDSCAIKTATSNLHSPKLVAPNNLTIPGRTPFTLTVTSGSDEDQDVVVYSWEEFDLGDPDPPNPLNPFDYKKIRPVFRSYPWSANSARTFPALDHILNPTTTYIAESLPRVNRTMVFRVTGRDTRGRFGYRDVRVRVIATRGSVEVGPFDVTYPDVEVVWHQGSTQTIRWKVANTDLPPIRCLYVKISLFTEEAPAHPIVLLDSTPNNGRAQIKVPDSAPLTKKARIRVEAINNVFFNVSPRIEIMN
jgi:hypothetical protein